MTVWIPIFQKTSSDHVYVVSRIHRHRHFAFYRSHAVAALDPAILPSPQERLHARHKYGGDLLGRLAGSAGNRENQGGSRHGDDLSQRALVADHRSCDLRMRGLFFLVTTQVD